MMYRVGILGTENSHATAFADLINASDTKYPDFKVTALYALEKAPSEAIQSKYPDIKIVDEIEEMLPLVDCVMVTSRHGKYHKDFVIPFIKAGMPAFVDKPFAIDMDEAMEIISAAKAAKVPLTGGSGCKYSDEVLDFKSDIESGRIGKIRSAMITFAVDLTSVHGGMYFYASHLTEIMLAVFGMDVRSIKAFVKDGHLTAIARYDTIDVIMNFCGSFTAVAYGDKGYAVKDITCNNIDKYAVDHFTQAVRTGVSSLTDEQLIMPVRIMNALQRSMDTGREELI